MIGPPGYWHTLEGCNQLFDGGQGQNGGIGAGRCLQVGARNRDVPVLAGKDFNLTVPNVARQPSDAGQLKCSAIERMGGVSDGDAALAGLRDERGITLGGVCPFPAARGRGRPVPRE